VAQKALHMIAGLHRRATMGDIRFLEGPAACDALQLPAGCFAMADQ